MFDSQRKTANLFDYSTTEIGAISTTDGSDVEFDSARRSDFIPVQAGVTYTFSGFGTNIRIFEYKPDKTYRNTNYLYTIPVEISRTGYIRIVGGLSDVLPSIMLNEGNIALPFEPYWQHSLRKLGTSTDTITTLPVDLYADGQSATIGLVGNMYQASGVSPTTPIQPSECGDLETEGAKAGQYKIPISSASTTTPVYLGEVESTRKIKKLVFDGTEDWRRNTDGVFYLISVEDYLRNTEKICICTHFETTTNRAKTADTDSNTVCFGSNQQLYRLFLNCPSFETAPQLTAYLAAQYANGTPVTVWYVLATPETAVINEPLRKIGDYADTVSGITIPTTTGKDSFDVQTTLKPSEVSLNYTGWHDAEVKEWDGSQWD